MLLAGSLGGCAVSMPMASLLPDQHDDTETATVAKVKLADWIGGEDWRQAKPAFAQALGADGAPANWSNPKSGAKGSFIALGQSYPGVSGRCRAFQADIDGQKADEVLEGTACADKSGDWQVTEIKPVKKS